LRIVTVISRTLQAVSCTLEPRRYVPWKGAFRSMYLIFEDDNALSHAVQEGIVAQPGAVFEVVRCKSNHSPVFHRPKIVVE
ncbi:hypothetical protein K432DRAFT_263931, partial [Lepidopterella palustris CBS 459.81]